MVVEYIRYTIPVDRVSAFEQDYAAARSALDASRHCLGYELARGVEEPTNFILRIEWDSIDGHEQGFRRSPEFRQFFQHVRPYVSEIAEMRHYAPVFSG